MRCAVLSVLTLGTLVSGCVTEMDALSGRYGPSPVPTAAAVQAATQRQMEVVMAMASVPRPENLPPFGNRGPWYQVIQAGFNVVDDACITYIDDLWILERRRNRNNSLIAAAGAATAGILAASSNPSASTLAILAQAFGFATVFNTAISDSYLYTQNAATIKKLIRKTAEAYRTDLAANYQKSEIDYPLASYAAAYHHMREYLALCLPPTIQAQIEDLVANAKAFPENSETDLRLSRARAQVTVTGQPVVVPAGPSAPAARSGVRATTSIRVQ
jgi:hypothetical protein